VLFPTIQYAVFFAVVLVASWVLTPRPVRWKLAMLAASYVFYAAWDPRFVGLLVGATVFNQVLALAIHRAGDGPAKRRFMWLAVGGNLGVLGWFKYYGFFAVSAANLFAAVGLPAPIPLLEIVLPVGISFFTFQAISYVDRHRPRRAHPGADPIDFADLPRHSSLSSSQGRSCGRASSSPSSTVAEVRLRSDAGRAFGLITSGLFKKVVVASYLASAIVDEVFANPAAHSAAEIAVAVLRLCRADLLPTSGIHRHRHRRGAAARVPLPARTSTGPTRPARCRTSGAAGT
jgi:alginate O-acetyltransferase complex protein AlgI